MTRRALLTGIDNYNDPRNNLTSCIADVEAVNHLVRSNGYDEVRVLKDAEVTIANVRAGLDWLCARPDLDDRLLFMFSGHGFQLPQGNQLEEVLCLYDGFFADDELSRRSQSLPPGVLTVLLDSCHSGGMTKPWFPTRQQGVEVARTKVWQPDEQLQAQVAADLGQVAFIKSFAVPRMATPATSSLSSAFGDDSAPRDKAVVVQPDEQGQLEVNGLLLTACLENETASSKTSATRGMSAFTFALVEALGKHAGIALSSRQVVDEATRILKDLRFRQTPVIYEGQAGLASATFLTLQPVRSSSPASGVADDVAARIAAALRNAFGIGRKDWNMTTPTNTMLPPAPAGSGADGDEKFWGAVLSVAAQVVPTILQAVAAGQKDFAPSGTASSPAAPAPAGSGADGDEKFWGAVLSVAAQVVPTILQAVAAGQKGMTIPQQSTAQTLTPVPAI